jgi:hypothetical protein
LNSVPLRGLKEERPEQARLGGEIMQLLVKRETSLADALDALTTVMLNALIAKYGKRDEFFQFSEQVSRFPESTERDREVGLIPRKQPGGLASHLQNFGHSAGKRSFSTPAPDYTHLSLGRGILSVSSRPQLVDVEGS